MSERQTFPILGNGGARIDWQLVLDHGEQAKQNHNQSVTRLAERGGLSWCELHAVLHDKRYQKMDTNEAMLACRALEARYLQAVCADLPPTLSAAMELPEVKALVVALEYGDRMCRLDFHREINPDDECFSQAVWDTWQRMVAAIAAIKEPKI